ncbi:glycoside hydrolase family 95 protein [Verrucomicrobiaceae bacterium N1E253]|uniref:Glycoside hydrolase family 95 protein n=1 Tax=Oceaniferula marina TaxID=2748318 RepID=A0A851G9Z0_9BACT|nr:glycoside hydrolase family 95 protein [Oceaniferula marina]NWK54548.1 glycoside hydrolase family 95 protein [Oceaniferula marina]
MKKLILIPILLISVLLQVQAQTITDARKNANKAYSAALTKHKTNDEVAMVHLEATRLKRNLREEQISAGLVTGLDKDARAAIFKKLKADEAYVKLQKQYDTEYAKLKGLLADLDPEYKAALEAVDKLAPKKGKPKKDAKPKKDGKPTKGGKPNQGGKSAKKLPKLQTKLTQSIGRAVFKRCETVFDRATVIWFRYPAGTWLEALPIGNGSFGAMVFGGVTEDVVQFNHDTLWTPPNISKEIVENPYPSKQKEISKIREMIFAGQEPEAHAYSREHLLHKYDVGAYQPLGELLFKYDFGKKPKKESIENYHRKLDMETGLTTVRFELEGTTYEREVFIADDEDVMILRMRATGEGTISTDMQFNRPMHFEHQKPVTQSHGTNMITLSGKAHGDKPSDIATSYQSVALATTKGGEVVSKDGVLSVRNAKEMIVYIAGATNFNAANPFKPSTTDLQATCIQLLGKLKAKGVEKAKADSVEAHQEIFGRVDIQLGPNLKNDMPTDERVKRSREMAEDEYDPYLTMQLFHMGRYLLITSSRPGSMAANLRGIWNSELKPSWNSDYHHDINVQMSYWSAEVTNMTEMHKPLFDLLKLARPRGQRVASEMFGCRGVFLPLLHGIYMTAYPPTPPASMWAMGGAWNATHVMEHYRFAGDKDYLKTEGYGIIKDHTLFCLDWLVKDPRSGKLVGGPDYSPETAFSVTPGGGKGTRGWGVLDMGCAMDQQIIWQIFTDFLEASKVLGIEDELTKEVADKLPRLAQTKIGKDGTIQEWSKDYESSEPDHRHISHMWGFYPGNQYHVDNAPDMLEAGRKTLEIRTDSDRGGRRVTWSNLYYVNFFARFGMGERALLWVNNLNRIRGFNVNLMGSQGQVQDCNYGYPSGVAEMLLQSHTGEIKLLPALPKAWSEGSVTGLVARGGFEVSMKWKEGKLTDAMILSKRGNPCTVTFAGKKVSLKLAAGEKKNVAGDLR